jgi:ADP-ribosylglycohydrolase
MRYLIPLLDKTVGAADLTSREPLGKSAGTQDSKSLVADRIRGTILGAACANSLGGPGLGMTRKEIMFAGGVHGFHEFIQALPKSLMPDYHPGELLSDTLVGLQLAESLIAHKGKFDADDFKQRLTKLLADDEFLLSNPGAHCLLPIRRLCEGYHCNDPDWDSSHVGPAARAFPVGCLPPKSDVVKIAVEQAELTQMDKRVSAAAAVLAHAVMRFVEGTRIDSEDQVREFVKEHLDIAYKIDERFAQSWDDVAPDLDYAHPADELPYSVINVDSHVNEAVPTAVGIFLIFRHDFEEAVAAAASCGGDTDTVAAIVGALSGAYHGASAIPQRWLNQISQRERLDSIADQLIALQQ